jgi:hypothetical protein
MRMARRLRGEALSSLAHPMLGGAASESGATWGVGGTRFVSPRSRACAPIPTNGRVSFGPPFRTAAHDLAPSARACTRGGVRRARCRAVW